MINFNDGMVGMLWVLAELGITPGSNSIGYYNKRQSQNIPNEQERNNLEKHQRKQVWSFRKRIWWLRWRKGGKTYGAGEL